MEPKFLGRFFGVKPWSRYVLLGLLMVGGALSCYEKTPVSLCFENDECLSGRCVNGRCVDTDYPQENDSDTNTGTDVITGYSEPMTGVDILFVVDNTSTMLHEQNKMGSAVRSLLLELTERLVGGLNLDLASIDARFAVITPDMGISFGDGSEVSYFPFDSTCDTPVNGDDGVMRTEISTEYNWDPTQPCPDIAPFIVDGMFLALNDNALYQEFRDAMTCMMPTGLHGCIVGQPLRATYAAFTQHGQNSFLRTNALTVIIAVSDRDDCSINDPIWFDMYDWSMGPSEMCVMEEEWLYTPNELYQRILAAKGMQTGVNAEGSVMFAAITGVPNVPECQGRGDMISSCGNASLPGGGTMDDPFAGGDTSPLYLNYACEEWSGDGEALVQAYPGMRYVRIAQEFGQLGYVSSVCNESWNYAMSDIADMVAACMAD